MTENESIAVIFPLFRLSFVIILSAHFVALFWHGLAMYEAHLNG